MPAATTRLLTPEEIAEISTRLPDWEVVDNHHLRKRWKFDDFRQALGFALIVGRLAEALDHHPDLSLGWGYLSVTLHTHDVGGLTELDVALALRLDLQPTSGHPDPFRSPQ